MIVIYKNNWLLLIVVFCVCQWIDTSVLDAQPLTQHQIRSGRYFTINSSAAAADGSIVSSGVFFTDKGDGLVVKTSASGAFDWLTNLGSATSAVAEMDVAVAADGSILVCGYQIGGRYVYIPTLTCLDAQGSVRWSKSYDLGTSCAFMGICRTTDGGIALVGFAQINDPTDRALDAAIVLKTDAQGIPQWARTTGFNKSVMLTNARVIECSDSSLLIGGNGTLMKDTFAASPTQLLFISHLSRDGASIAQATYRSDDHNVGCSELKETSTGDFMICGMYSSLGGFDEALILRLSDSLQLQWAKAYNFFSPSTMQTVCEEPNGEYIGLSPGRADSTTPAHLFRVSSNGDLIAICELSDRAVSAATLTRTYPTAGRYTVTSIATDGIHAGTTLDVTSVTSGFTGCAIVQTLASATTANLHDTILSVSYSPLTVTADTVTISGTLIASEDTIACSQQQEIVEESASARDISIYPNPVSSGMAITIDIGTSIGKASELILRDLTGREVYRTHREATSAGEQVQIPTAGLASGVYAVELVDASSFANVWRGKVVVE